MESKKISYERFMNPNNIDSIIKDLEEGNSYEIINGDENNTIIIDNNFIISLNKIEKKVSFIINNPVKLVNTLNITFNWFIFNNKVEGVWWWENTIIYFEECNINYLIANSSNLDIKIKNTYFNNLIFDLQCWKYNSKIEIEYNNNKKNNKEYSQNIEIKNWRNCNNIKINWNNNIIFWSIKLINFDTIKENWEYLINQIKCKTFEISKSINFSNKFIITDFETEKLLISDSNLGEIILNEFSITKSFYTKRSLFNNWIFNNVDFSQIWYKISDKNPTDDNKLNLKELKDSYRQLKFVMDKNLNFTEANKFYEKEMEYYLEYINSIIWFDKWWFTSLRNDLFTWDNSKLLWEWISLNLWKYISEFWNNWLKPIFLILILAIISANIQYLYISIIHLINNPISFQYYTNIDFKDLYSPLLQLIFIIFIWIIIIKLTNKYFFTSLVLLLFIIHFILWYNIFDRVALFLYPLYWLDKNMIIWMSFIEIIWLILYKIIYWILLWYLIIASKRTTKR